MAVAFDKKRKCFTFIWKVKNPDHRDLFDCKSPIFAVDEIEGTKWTLSYLSSSTCKYLGRVRGGPDSVTIDCEIAILSANGEVLLSQERGREVVRKNELLSFNDLGAFHERYAEKRSLYVPDDTLTVRCRLWRSDGEILENRQIIAHTCIPVLEVPFRWDIPQFNLFPTNGKQMYTIRSPRNGKGLFSLELDSCESGEISLEAKRLSYKGRRALIKVDVVNVEMNSAESLVPKTLLILQVFNDSNYVRCTKRDLMSNKNRYFPNNTLTLVGKLFVPPLTETGESASITSSVMINASQDNRCSDGLNDSPTPESILKNDLKCLLNNTALSDVRLKTSTKTYTANKCILCARSPVFLAMFSYDMTENTTESVDIGDFSEKAVELMLQYIYSAEVGELDWGAATELYKLAVKYKILNLKEICASYLKSNLAPHNTCQTLVFADLEQDEGLKRFVQDFILKQGEELLNSEEWDQLMETNLKLAAETMHLKYKRLKK